MIDFIRKESYGLKDLENIVAILRAPGGCPWDAEQTHTSARRDLLEESYEVVEAIDEGSAEHLKEELGDLLLQVFMHAEMEREQGGFTVDDVADGICKKLIYRHPHVFGQVEVKDSAEVLVNWEALKRTEKGQDTYTDPLQAVAKSLPALWRAEKVQKKARKAGFDWERTDQALEKLDEEARELKEAIAQGTNVEEELGDLLFAAVNVSRFVGVDSEMALHAASEKFIARFARVEALAREQGRDMKDMTPEQLDELWEQAKRA